MTYLERILPDFMKRNLEIVRKMDPIVLHNGVYWRLIVISLFLTMANLVMMIIKPEKATYFAISAGVSFILVAITFLYDIYYEWRYYRWSTRLNGPRQAYLEEMDRLRKKYDRTRKFSANLQRLCSRAIELSIDPKVLDYLEAGNFDGARKLIAWVERYRPIYEEGVALGIGDEVASAIENGQEEQAQEMVEAAKRRKALTEEAARLEVADKVIPLLTQNNEPAARGVIDATMARQARAREVTSFKARVDKVLASKRTGLDTLLATLQSASTAREHRKAAHALEEALELVEL